MVLVDVRLSRSSTIVRTYLWVELELDHVSSVGLDAVGKEGKGAI